MCRRDVLCSESSLKIVILKKDGAQIGSHEQGVRAGPGGYQAVTQSLTTTSAVDDGAIAVSDERRLAERRLAE